MEKKCQIKIRKTCVSKIVLQLLIEFSFFIHFRFFPRDTLHCIIMQDVHNDANMKDKCIDLENLPNFIVQMIEKV